MNQAEISHPRQEATAKMARMRTHLSVKPGPILTLVEKRQPRDVRELPGGKPRGLWYEIDGAFRRWCRENEWSLEGRQYIHAVELGDSRLLVVDTLEKLDAFHREYRYRADHDRINWLRVSRDYDGIEIAPYQWARRGDYYWYWAWDCASGVIWRPRNVTVTYLRKLRTRKPE